MSNITGNSSDRTIFDLLNFYFILFLSLSLSIHAFSPVSITPTTITTVHVTCGTDIALTCPISSLKKSDEVISWFRPNSSENHLKFIAIGDILFPEYATMGRFNLVPSSSSLSRLLISNVLTEDHGFYTCKSSSTGQHSIQLMVHSRPLISPPSPLLLYPVNRTFSITCSMLCPFEQIELSNLRWLVNGDLLTEDSNDFHIENISRHTQRLTVYLHKRTAHFFQGNYTCEYEGKQSTIFVRRRTKDELHRLPRQQGSSVAHLLQTVFDAGVKPWQSLSMIIVCLLSLCLF